MISACTMDICNSSVNGNIETLEKLLKQVSIRDPDKVKNLRKIVDMRKFVILFYGDLRMEEWIAQAQVQWSIESTTLHQLQFSIFIFKQFHLKMACTDVMH